jgi:hypothetical protein
MISNFKRVLKTLKHNKIMVKATEEGVFIRFAGKEEKGELFSLEWLQVTGKEENK